ncbi:hypothetical Protein YC6258_00060 [Gynuella sunshinyii YC6258]|uniref:Uncharacterized protein n=1 Tax=Gynuella sunshinyii YC6258 TaxID=1445510 RepID=A0A0C5VCY2_9GAMM|nr:hypothetical Protein YC6258_00060 [Gynuella sunshinyii YC6258]
MLTQRHAEGVIGVTKISGYVRRSVSGGVNNEVNNSVSNMAG